MEEYVHHCGYEEHPEGEIELHRGGGEEGYCDEYHLAHGDDEIPEI